MLKITFIALAAALCIGSVSLPAQPLPKDYPNKPIRVIVPSPPGGPPDLIIRMLMPKLSAGLGQPLVINRAGAGGIVGTLSSPRRRRMATRGSSPPPHTRIRRHSTKTCPFDPVRDFSHVSLVAQNFGQALVVPPSFSGEKRAGADRACARSSPGKLNYGSAGIGTASHIPAEVMKSMIRARHRGRSIQGRAGGHDRRDRRTHGHVLRRHADRGPLVQSGKLRALALTGAKRWKGLPDVPTMQESGFKGYNLINWFGLWLPAGASRELSRLHAEM